MPPIHVAHIFHAPRQRMAQATGSKTSPFLSLVSAGSMGGGKQFSLTGHIEHAVGCDVVVAGLTSLN